jgi:hypothetical protein
LKIKYLFLMTSPTTVQPRVVWEVENYWSKWAKKSRAISDPASLLPFRCNERPVPLALLVTEQDPC